MSIMVVPFGQFAPDTMDVTLSGAPQDIQVLSGVIPMTAQGYGPMSKPAALTTVGLTSRCQGAFSMVDNTGAPNLFAGDAAKLYKLSGSSMNAVGSGYLTQSEGIWVFDCYGNHVYATNGYDPIQVFTANVSTAFSVLSANAPVAKTIAVFKNFLIAGNCVDATYGAVPSSVWWSAVGNPASWPTIGSPTAAQFLSDRQELQGNYGGVQAIAAGVGGGAAIIMERGVWRAIYVGSPSIFQFDLIEALRGTPSAASVVVTSGIVRYLGEDGFYAYDGQQAVPIGAARVNKFFFNDCDSRGLNRVVGAVDPINQLCFWVYPRSISGGSVAPGYLAYNYAVDRWASGDLAVELIFRAIQPGWTLEQIGAAYPNLEGVPFSLDSRVWKGGATSLGAFSQDHQLSFFTGNPMAAVMETEDANANGRLMTVRGLRPIIDGAGAQAQIGYRMTAADDVNYTPVSSPAADGQCPARISARYVRARVIVPEDTSWSHCQGAEVDAVQDGMR